MVQDAPNAALTAEDAGLHKGLKSRQIQMIAIGGAIGTGLFMGAGGRLGQRRPGPDVQLRHLRLLCLPDPAGAGRAGYPPPSSGSFVSYAREFFGEKAAFVSGWLYWLNWAMTAIVDITAVALYMHFFAKYVPWMGSVPQWIWALAALLRCWG